MAASAVAAAAAASAASPAAAAAAASSSSSALELALQQQQLHEHPLPLLDIFFLLPKAQRFSLCLSAGLTLLVSFHVGRKVQLLVHHGQDRELGPGGAVAVSQLKPGPVPEADDIPRIHQQAREIATLSKQPVLRNLLITQCYHDISVALSAILNPPGQQEKHANWCTIAQWASKNVGAFIRQEFLPDIVRGLLRQHDGFRTKVDRMYSGEDDDDGDGVTRPPRELDAHGHHVRTLEGRGGTLDVAQYVAGEITEYMIEGNLKVFAELGPIFGDLIACYSFNEQGLPVLDVPAFENLEKSLKPGPAQPTAQNDGQDMLKWAIRAFREAVETTDDPKRKAELVLLFNVYTGLHEQTRLQPCIQGSLDVGAMQLFEKLIGNPEHVRARREARIWPLNWIGRVHTALDNKLIGMWRTFSTRFAMTLPIPGQELKLGRMMPKPCGSTTFFPPLLAKLDEERFLDERFVRYGSTMTEDDDNKHRIGADNWACLDNRMRYIFGLFRSRHFDPAIFEEPFQPKVRDLIVTDRLVPRNALL